MDDLTLERLQELVTYDPLTGHFRWRTRRSGQAAPGSIAGRVIPANGYVELRVLGKKYRGHRLAFFYMTGGWPAHEVDHKNGNRADNRWDNLRAATRLEQRQNTAGRVGSTKSGLLGVGWSNRWKKYRARIGVGGKLYHLGWFEDPEKAHSAYKEAKARLHTFQPAIRAGG